ncbi:MAG TPA: hypothetical protein VF678_03825 [bacterium]
MKARINLPQPDPVALLRWADRSPLHWLALLAAAGPWVRVPLGPITLYPLHILLTGLIGWALLGTQRRALIDDVPLFPAVLLAGWVALLTLFRAQWGALAGVAIGGSALWVWGWAASGVGRQSPGPRHFAEAGLIFLVTTLGLGAALWAVQWWVPDLCRLVNCDPQAGIPYPFRGGWHTHLQYVVVLMLLMPFCVDPLMRSLRDSRAGRARLAMLGLTLCAGLAVLAGARWWVLLIVALGELLFTRVLASDRHPLDRLFVRGMVFFTLFGAVALYGLAPGYLGPLLTGRSDSRAGGVQMPPGSSQLVLSSDRVTPVPIRLLNTGWSDLRAADERPLRMSAMLLFTPRTGLTRAYPGGEVLLYQTVPPGDALDVTVPVTLPHWVNTGFVMWQLHDAAGTPIPITAGSKGFRFANASYYALDQTGDNQLTAVAGRARAFVTRALPPPQDHVDYSSDNLPGNAFDTLFFSPLWGHRSEKTTGFGPFNTSQSLWLQILYSYGLVGLGLAAWFGLRTLRQSWQLAQSNSRGGARLAWRMLPVAVVLLAALAMLSGEPARYHSLWGSILLAGYVEGTHRRQFPSSPKLRFRVPTPERMRGWWRQGTWMAGQVATRFGRGDWGRAIQDLKLPNLRLPRRMQGFRLPGVRFRLSMPKLGVPTLRLLKRLPRVRLPRVGRLLARRPPSPLYPSASRRWRLPRVQLPKIRLPRWRWNRTPPWRRR